MEGGARLSGEGEVGMDVQTLIDLIFYGITGGGLIGFAIAAHFIDGL